MRKTKFLKDNSTSILVLFASTYYRKKGNLGKEREKEKIKKKPNK